MTLYSSLLIKNLLHEYVFVAAGLKKIVIWIIIMSIFPVSVNCNIYPKHRRFAIDFFPA